MRSPFIPVCVYIYIYIYRERERETERGTGTSRHTHVQRRTPGPKIFTTGYGLNYPRLRLYNTTVQHELRDHENPELLVAKHILAAD